MLPRLLALLLLAATVVPSMGQLANGGALPSDAEIQGLKNLCAGGNVQVLQISGNLDAAIVNWKKAAAGVEVSVAKKDLGGAIAQVKNDSNLAAVTKIYVDCVSDNLQRFLDREERKAKPISRTGQSASLLRSAFVSDEDMRSAGCGEAEEDARRKLKADCGSRVLALVSDASCSSTSGSPRTFRVRLDGECRVQ